MDSLELKVPEDDLESHLREVRHISTMDKDRPLCQAKGNKADKDQQTLSATRQRITGHKEQEHKVGEGPGPASWMLGTKAVATPVTKPITAPPIPMRASV